MNSHLQYLLNTGDVVNKRTLQFFMNRLETSTTLEDLDFREGSISVAYTTEYMMNSVLGPFKWYLTWLAPDCPDRKLAQNASIVIHDARARMYFPPYLDTRIPPENREGLEQILRRYKLSEYDKFDLVKATKGWSPIKLGNVREVDARDCPYTIIHAIDEIIEEYKRTL